MSAWIRGSRIVAAFLISFMLWNELATYSVAGNIDAASIAGPGEQPAPSVRGARPPNLGPDVLMIAPRLAAPSPTVPVPSPTASPPPLAEVTKPLGTFRVTGYSDSLRNGTDGRGITKSGEKTRWGVVAVDPGVVPLGSRLRIDGLGDTEFVALDTGGAVNGKSVDVWFGDDVAALNHGVKYLEVELIEEP